MQEPICKICGADIEVGNTIVDPHDPSPARDTSGEASRALLSEIRGRARPAVVGQYQFREEGGFATSSWSDSSGGYFENVQDQGRKFLTATGGCVYIDLQHLEACTPELRSAFDHCGAVAGMLRIVRDAMDRVNDRLAPGRTLKVFVNNSDGHGNSYGSHLNFLVTRECYDNLFHRRLHMLQFLASFQSASIVMTGAGKVGNESGDGAEVRYQISARADFFEALAGPQTTFKRPICNTRDEALTGPTSSQLARVHCIFYDNTLAHFSSVLKVGMMQIVLAMLEQGCIPARWLLDDPVAAVKTWSRDPELRATSPLIDGTPLTAVELMSGVFEAAKKFADEGRCEGIVPDAHRLLAMWGECLDRLVHRDIAYLVRRIDWVAKYALLDRAASRDPHGWHSPRVKTLDHLYSSLDPREGVYWALERAGAMERLLTDAQIERFAHEPPDDTRAWLRSYVLRNAPAGLLDDVDWDMLRLRVEDERFSAGGWLFYRYPTLHLTEPHRFTRAECEAVLRSSPTLLEGLNALGLGGESSANSNQEVPHGNATASTSHDRPRGRD